MTKVTSRHLLSTGTHGEQQVLAVLGTHGGMRDKSSEQMYSDVLKHRKGKGRVKFSDTSVLEDTCANLFLHFFFFFSWRKGLLCLALWVRQHLDHHSCPHTSIPDLLKLVSALHTGFGN